MRYPLLVALFTAVIGLCAPVAAQERTDWSLMTTFKATGKICSLRFAVPKGSFSLTLENRPAKGKRAAQAVFTLGGLPPYLAAEKLDIRNIQLGVDGRPASGIKGSWRKGSTDKNSKLIVVLPFNQLLGSLSKGLTLKIEVPFGSNVQSFDVALKGSAAPVVGFATCMGSPQ